MTLNDNPIRLRRLEAGLSQTELARRAELQRSSLVAIEEGQIQHPKSEVLDRLGLHLGQVPGSVLRTELDAWLAVQAPRWSIAQRAVLDQPASEIARVYPSFRAWRQHLDVSIPRLAGAMKVSRSALYEYESGLRVGGMSDTLLSGLLRLGLPRDTVLALAELPNTDPDDA